MVGVIIWALAVIAIFLLLKEPYDYKFFIACYKGLIFSVKWIWQFLLGRWKWLISLPNLKKAYVIIAGLVGAALLFLFTRLYLEVLWIDWNNIGEDDGKIRNLAIAFVGTITGIGALFGVYLAILRSEENKRQNDVAEKQSQTAIDQSKTAEQGLITDRINKATEGLGKNHENGKPVLEIRIGAIYALERIAKDSERDHVPIMELFCAYIRTNSSNDDKDTITKNLREDIRIILNIIRRRDKWTPNKGRLELERIQGMYFNFYNCYLRLAELYGANLSGANFYKANLETTWLNGVNLSRARLTDVKIKSAVLIGVKTTGAYAESGNFSGCKTLNQEQINQMFLGKGVVLPKGLIHPQKDSKYDRVYDGYNNFMNAYNEWLIETGY